jgi:hypothetical protein
MKPCGGSTCLPIRSSSAGRGRRTFRSTTTSSRGSTARSLKSSNGTFLNGKRVERVRIKSEDVIEIGNTVIVLLESATWRRGKNLPRLRNPRKAKKLIQTLNKRGALARTEKVAPPATRGERQARLRQKRALTASEAAFVSWAETEFLKHPAARELIKEYLEHQIVATLVRNSTALRDLISAALEKVLVAGALVDDPRALEERIDDVVRHVASRGMLEAGPGSGDGAAGGRS